MAGRADSQLSRELEIPENLYLYSCTIFLFCFILTLIWLVSYAELLDTYLFSQKIFEGIKTETWVRLGEYHKEYVVSREK